MTQTCCNARSSVFLWTRKKPASCYNQSRSLCCRQQVELVSSACLLFFFSFYPLSPILFIFFKDRVCKSSQRLESGLRTAEFYLDFFFFFFSDDAVLSASLDQYFQVFSKTWRYRFPVSNGGVYITWSLVHEEGRSGCSNATTEPIQCTVVKKELSL